MPADDADAPDPTPPAPRRRGGRSGIDWDAARLFFLERGPKRTYNEVARNFDVSNTSVGIHARKNGWPDAAVEYDRAVADEVARKSVRSRAQRVAQALRITDRLLDRYETEFASLDVKVADLPGLVKLAELLEGEATDRVSVGEVQTVIRTVFLVAGRFVPLERRDEFRQELDGALSGVAALMPASEGLAA